jgi:hypothetical protein
MPNNPRAADPPGSMASADMIAGPMPCTLAMMLLIQPAAAL